MYQTISKNAFRDAFIRMGRKENFSYEGLGELYDYLVMDEADGDMGIELDVIALCCEFSEDSIDEVLDNYNLKSLEELQDNTIVVWHNDTNVLYMVY